MSLTREQKKDLSKLTEYFKKIEKIATENNLDLDVFMSEYRDSGFSSYSIEKIDASAASQRKKIFEAEGEIRKLKKSK
jgi:hypothetical protein